MFKCPISHREGWRKKRVLVQGSNPAQPSCWVFIKSRKQMDRHSCRRCCDFSGKGTCSMQEWQHSTAALPHSPCCSRRCVSDENPPGTAYSSQCGTLVCAHGQLALEELKLVEEKCIKDCLVFLQYAGGPVPVRLPFYLHQKHLIASGPCWILPCRLDSCRMKRSCELIGSQTPEKPLGCPWGSHPSGDNRKEGPAAKQHSGSLSSHSCRAGLMINHCSRAALEKLVCVLFIRHSQFLAMPLYLEGVNVYIPSRTDLS